MKKEHEHKKEHEKREGHHMGKHHGGMKHHGMHKEAKGLTEGPAKQLRGLKGK